MPYREFSENSSVEVMTKMVVGVSFFAFLAGNTNTSLLVAGSITVSHVTGNFSHLAEWILSSSFSEAGFIARILLSFFAGTITSGLFLVSPQFSTQRKYGLVTLLEGLALLIAAKIGEKNIPLCAYLCSYGMGIQNAMISSYKGLIVRTTHMTGVLTDLGFLLGSALRKGEWRVFRLFFFANLIFFFVGGCCAGYFLTKKYGLSHLYLSSFMAFFAGFVYFFLGKNAENSKK